LIHCYFPLPLGEGWGEGLGCELQLITFGVECHSRTVETKKDCSVNPHPQPFSQWEKEEKGSKKTENVIRPAIRSD